MSASPVTDEANLSRLPGPADYDVIIVGAGIAGLTAAWQLRDHRVLILEAAERPGGRICSEPRGDYWLNLGPHLFPGPETVLGTLVTSMGLRTRPVTGSTQALSFAHALLTSGGTSAFPFRLPLSLPARASLLRAGIAIRRGVRAYVRLGRRGPGQTEADVTAQLLAFKDDRSFADFLGPLHPDADAILRAAIRRVSADPEELSAGAGIAQFATTFSRAGTSLHHNLPGGASVLIRTIADRLAGRLRTSCQVTSVRQGGAVAEVDWITDGHRHSAQSRNVIVATPAGTAREIIAGLPPDTASALGAIRYGPYVVAALLTAETGPMPWDSIYAMVTPRCSFNMFFNTVNVLRDGARQPGGSLMVYGASDLARILDSSTDDEVIAAFLPDLAAIFPGLPALVSEARVQRWPQGIPYSAPGRHTW
ncbi:MAG: flavin monoamine oxidase family protein, partial [Streptosporangiaceae bacterium]